MPIFLPASNSTQNGCHAADCKQNSNT